MCAPIASVCPTSTGPDHSAHHVSRQPRRTTSESDDNKSFTSLGDRRAVTAENARQRWSTFGGQPRRTAQPATESGGHIVLGDGPAPGVAQNTATAGKGSGSSRIAILDALRLLAALAVLAKHWVGVGAAGITSKGDWVYPWGAESTEALFGPMQAPAVYGWLGVHLFFLISGFVICMSGWGRSIGRFLTSRVARLFPAYWFAVVVTVIVVKFFPGLTNGEVRGGLQNALLNLTMVQTAYQGPSVDPSYWTLWWELKFYLLFAVLLAFGLTYRRVMAFCGLWTIGAMIAAATDDSLADVVAMPQYAPYFISGVAFSLMFRYGPNMLLWGVIGLNYFLALHLVRQDTASQMRESDLTQHTDKVVAIAVTCCFVTMALVALHAFDRVRWRWLTVAGALTYPLYLLHQVIGFVIIRELRPHLSPMTIIGVTLAGMLVLAWLVQRFVEPPMGRWLRHGLDASFAAIREQSKAIPPRT